MNKEKWSRVKKYEELRDRIEEAIIEEKKEEYTPLREHIFYEVPQFKIKDDSSEYLDKFIQEVREYNQQKGLCSDNTQLDILNSVPIDEEDTTSIYEDDQEVFEFIAKQVQQVTHEVDDEVVENTSIEEQKIEDSPQQTTLMKPKLEEKIEKEEIIETIVENKKIEDSKASSKFLFILAIIGVILIVVVLVFVVIFLLLQYAL